MGTYLHPDQPPDLDAVVALYSGGVDSYCMSYLCQPDVLLNVNMGGRYGDCETSKMVPPDGFAGLTVKLECKAIGQQEDAVTSIIPGRNAFLALFGSWYGSTLLLASIFEEAHVGGADKDEGFAAALAGLFDHMLQPQRWLPQGRTVRLLLPVHHLTKAQLVGRALLAGHDPQALAANTFSCYQPVSRPTLTEHFEGTDHGGIVHTWLECGECGACARKWAAFAVWGVDVGFSRPAAVREYMEEAKRLYAAGLTWPDWKHEAHRVKAERTGQWVADQMDAWSGVVRPVEHAERYPMWERVRPTQQTHL